MINLHKKDSIQNIVHYAMNKFHALRLYYLRLTKQQRLVLTLGVGLVIILLFTLSLIHSNSKITKQASSMTFTTNAALLQKSARQGADVPTITTSTAVQQQLADAQKVATKHYQTVNTKLQTIQSGLGQVASRQSVAQLQQTVAAPNPVLLTKVNRLQQSVNVIKRQTAKKTFIPAKMVEKYFRLAAVQVFSDGMRAIIDVQGHQTLLSTNEVCPACRGWTLKSMDFANQSAVFENNKQQYVNLQTN